MRNLRNLIILWIFISLTTATICFAENPWLIRINIPEFKLYLYHANEIYQTFNIAVGKQETPSPLGEFWIANKVVDPTWYPPDGKPPVPAGPDNPLGKYWLGLNIEGYGIHGNSAAWSIGSPASLGCFRLHNKDIHKLFNLVPVRTKVQIVYETVRAGIDSNNTAWLEVFPDIYNWLNQEVVVQNSIKDLNWEYTPHWRALGQILKTKKPLKVEIPRLIKIEGDSAGMDGFYWERRIYLAKNNLNILPVNINIKIFRDGAPFSDYVKLDTTDFIVENKQYHWDYAANTLRITHIKVLLNGTEVSDEACRFKDNRILVKLKKVAELMDAKFSWDDISKVAICNDVMIPGEPWGGCFWAEPGELAKVWPKLTYDWDEKNGVLELNSNCF